ncbi:MAG: protein translocase subunit SecF [Polyangiaceae bacterium]|nr:protein translocase subunit SecF [Polyangiaceae bacterium]
MEFLPPNKIYDFMGLRHWFLGASVVTFIIALILLFVVGPKFGPDFSGGTEIEVEFKQPVTADEIRQAVTASGFSQPDVIRVAEATTNRFMIRVPDVSSIDDATRIKVQRKLCFGDNLPAAECPEEKRATEVKFSPGGEKISIRFRQDPDLAWIKERMMGVPHLALRAGNNNPSLQNARDRRVEVFLVGKGDQLLGALKSRLGAAKVPDAALRVEWIGPKAGALLRDSAIKSLAISLVGVLIYLAFRFDLRFAPGAIVALFHDAVVAVAILVALQKELNLVTVAAILTLVGYSVNDTVVVYDRVRENLGKMRGSTFSQLINVSLSETLSRTILTGVTTVLSLLAFFVWGTGALKDFALTLIIGIILGTYSSIYVALPLTEWMDRKFFAKLGGNKAGKARSGRVVPAA